MGKFFQRKRLFLYSLLLTLIVGCGRSSNVRSLPQIVGVISTTPHGPGSVAANSKTGNIYVIAGSAVAILNGSHQVAMIQTEAIRPKDIAVDEEEGWVYVGDEFGRHVTVLKDTEFVADVEVPGEFLLDVAVESDSGRAYVVTGYTAAQNEGEKREVNGRVTIVMGTEIIGTVSLGDVLPTQVVANPINGNVYIGTLNGTLIIINGMDEIARLELNSGIDAIDVNPETGEIFIIADQELHQIKETDLIASIDLIEGNGSLMNMRVDPTTGNVYVINTGWEVIVVRNSRVIGRLDVGRALQAMTVDPLTGNVYVADYYEDKVTVINGTEVIGSFDVGWYPYGIGVNPANGWVYVSNTNDDTITVLGFE